MSNAENNVNNPSRREMLVGLTLCPAAALLGGMAGLASGQETASSEQPPVEPGASRASQAGTGLFPNYADIYGIAPEVAKKIMSGLYGGIGHLGGTCSTVTGAVILLGLRHSTVGVDNDEVAYPKMVALAKQFAEDFKERYKSILCRERTQCDISTPELYALAKQTPEIFTDCYEGAKVIAELLETKYDILNPPKTGESTQ